jgi:pimeloyl-ACP methyl ester carboxylesterase
LNTQPFPAKRVIEVYMRQNLAMSAYTTPIPLSGRGLTAKLVRQTESPKSDKDDETRAIDIVAVHGLNPWESYTGSPFWLRDFIAKDIRGARVFTFDYDVKAVWLCEAPLEGIQGVTRALLAQIAAIREEVPATRPLVLIGHGFGGFIVESVGLCFSQRTPPIVVSCS